EPRSPSHSM
nr:Chain C, MLL cleavage product N320 peptide [Homo sapiens]7S8F_C Chain C, MLL cleavage product N320 peptide [Homo sapiens]